MMTLSDAYRRHAQKPVAPDDGTASWLLRAVRSLREIIKRKAAPGQADMRGVISDLNRYEELIQRLQPLTDLADSEGYRQWREDTLARLDEDLRGWPEEYLQRVKSGHSAEQLAMDTAIFATNQVTGRRAFLLVDQTKDEQVRHALYQERAKAQEGEIT